jgi:hypothetical protein
MPVALSTRKHLDDHLGQAEFALKVASNFDCLKSTPAHAKVSAALAQVAEARAWIIKNVELEKPWMGVGLPPLGQGLPLTRKERLGYRWP